MRRIGIFGGAFNPVHNGHIHLAKTMIKDLALDSLLIIPTKKSPHKQSNLLPYAHREAMLKLAFANDIKVEISDIEQHIEGKSYTIKTINKLRDIYPKDKLFLIIGSDMLFTFDQWYKYKDILRECQVVAAARENGEYVQLLELTSKYSGAKILQTEVVEVSSTEIRERFANNQSIADLMPQACVDYIRENNLFLEER